jgi:chorismate dehydratase
LEHLDHLAEAAAGATGLQPSVTREYLGDLDYALSYRHLAGLTDFFRRLAHDGLVPDGSLSFITAA